MFDERGKENKKEWNQGEKYERHGKGENLKKAISIPFFLFFQFHFFNNFFPIQFFHIISHYWEKS